MRTNRIIIFLIALAGCSDQTDKAAKYAQERAQQAEYNRFLAQEYAEELEAEEDDEDTLMVTQQTFMGRPCTIDCSGHEAGYRWAEENGIDDPNECDGNSNSFNEGCQSYVEEQQ